LPSQAPDGSSVFFIATDRPSGESNYSLDGHPCGGSFLPSVSPTLLNKSPRLKNRTANSVSTKQNEKFYTITEKKFIVIDFFITYYKNNPAFRS
jgi:hypothetical protein